MSLAISVRDYRGCERADVSVSTIALIAGLNGAGKSSLIDGAAAALSQTPIPSFLKKKDAQLLVRRGADKAKITVVVDKSATTVNLPAGEVVSDGPPLRVSQYAAGIVSVLDMSEKDRRQVLAQYLNAEPDREALADALKDEGIEDEPDTEPSGSKEDKKPHKPVTEIWEFIKLNGWDTAHKKWQELGARNKGRWEAATGDKYGGKKAQGWVPSGWEEDLASATPAALADELAQAKAELEKALKASAVDEDRIATLRAEADKITKLTEQLERAKTTEAALEKKSTEAEQAYKALPAPPAETDHPPCPHCGVEVAVSSLGGHRYQLLKPDKIDKKAVAKMQAALDDGRKAASKALDDFLDANKTRSAISADLSAAQKAKAELDRLTSAPKADKAVSVDDLRAKVARAETRQKLFETERTASHAHAEVVALVGIVNTLAPDGLRKRRMTRAIEKFNGDLLRPIAERASFGEIKLNEELEPYYRGTPYPFASASEKFRVRVALQIAMASLDKSQLVLIDGADMLDQPGRNGLFELLAKLSIPSVVGMTLSTLEKVPDLEQAGIGQSYWIADGICKPIRGGESSRQAAE